MNNLQFGNGNRLTIRMISKSFEMKTFILTKSNQTKIILGKVETIMISDQGNVTPITYIRDELQKKC